MSKFRISPQLTELAIFTVNNLTAVYAAHFHANTAILKDKGFNITTNSNWAWTQEWLFSRSVELSGCQRLYSTLLSRPLPSLPLHSPPFPFSTPLSYPYLPSLSLKLEIGTFKSSQRSGAGLQPKSNLAHFSIEIWHLVAILMIFLRINLPKVRAV